MTKQEVIQKAYGEYWDSVKDYVDAFGWLMISKYEDKFDDLEEDMQMIDYFDYELEVNFSRPASLEFWNDILGYEGIYQISDLGRVKSLQRTKRSSSIGIQNVKEKVLTNINANTGYLKVTLCKDGKYKTPNVHRIVLESFAPNLENKLQGNHRNGNKKFNWLINLEWNTRSENIKHADKIGLRKMPKGENHCNYGMNSSNHGKSIKVINTSTGVEYGSVLEASNNEGIGYNTLLGWLRGDYPNKSNLIKTDTIICKDCGRKTKLGVMYCDPCNKFNSI